MEDTKQENIVIKIGGLFLQNRARLAVFFSELAEIQTRYHIVVVHGGGNKISAYSKSYGIKARFTQEGLRLTSEAEMLHTDRILAGEINTYLVRTACACGIDAIGLSAVDGALIKAQSVQAHTGRVKSCNARVLQTLTYANYVPIVCSVASAEDGMALNINADEVAQAIACTLSAQHMVSVSDVSGIIIEGQQVRYITEKDIYNHIQSGAIHGGMVTKTQSALTCLESGVDTVIIGTFSQHGNLDALLKGTLGTRIVRTHTT